MLDCSKYKNQNIKLGDILFFRSKSLNESSDNFISAVSASFSEPIYHVAMVMNSSDYNIQIIESVPSKGVIVGEYKNICDLENIDSKIEVNRLNLKTNILKKSVYIATKYIGIDYNDIFSYNCINSKGSFALYCSQLIQTVYNFAANNEIFKYLPMSFKAENGETIPYWINYFNNLNSTIPEGELGSHPGGLYDSDFLMSLAL